MKLCCPSIAANEKLAIVRQEDLECFICWNTLANPQQCKNGHCFCKSCLQDYRQSNKPECPVCKVNVSAKNTSEALFAKNVVGSLMVDCQARHFDRGHLCGWCGPSSALNSHSRNECLLQSIPCPIHTDSLSHAAGGCPGTIVRGDLVDHALATLKQSQTKESELRRLADSALVSLKESQQRIKSLEMSLREETAKVKVAEDSLLEMKTNAVKKSVDKYTGMRNADSGKKEGFGIMEYSNGTVCAGFWKDDVMCSGTYVAYDGVAFMGQFDDRGRAVKGEVRYPDGTIYNGAYDEIGLPVGRGKLTHSGGNVAEGTFSKGLQEGFFFLTHPDGCKFSGHFTNNRKCGYGKVVFADGGSYESQWKDDKMHGEGTLKNPHDIVVYCGMWKNAQRDYRHEVRYVDGRVYVGEWSKNRRNGMGTLTNPNHGNVYCGEWKDDKKHGYGVLTNANGERMTL